MGCSTVIDGGALGSDVPASASFHTSVLDVAPLDVGNPGGPTLMKWAQIKAGANTVIVRFDTSAGSTVFKFTLEAKESLYLSEPFLFESGLELRTEAADGFVYATVAYA